MMNCELCDYSLTPQYDEEEVVTGYICDNCGNFEQVGQDKILELTTFGYAHTFKVISQIRFYKYPRKYATI